MELQARTRHVGKLYGCDKRLRENPTEGGNPASTKTSERLIIPRSGSKNPHQRGGRILGRGGLGFFDPAQTQQGGKKPSSKKTWSGKLVVGEGRHRPTRGGPPTGLEKLDAETPQQKGRKRRKPLVTPGAYLPMLSPPRRDDTEDQPGQKKNPKPLTPEGISEVRGKRYSGKNTRTGFGANQAPTLVFSNDR